MSNSDTALIVIDVQKSFRHESCWSHSPGFCQRLQQLIDGAKKREIRIVQIFHAEPEGTLSITSGNYFYFRKLLQEMSGLWEKSLLSPTSPSTRPATAP